MNIEDLWQKAIQEHNSSDFHEAHEIFEDLWLELDDRNEKDIVQTLAQADALAVHLETGNLRAAQRLMRQLPELLENFPNNYRSINLTEMKQWIVDKISKIPQFGIVSEISAKVPPKLLDSRD
jgi:predicted metal-dependent hydrolase